MRPARPLPPPASVVALLVALAGLSAAAAPAAIAATGTLYRCIGADGVSHFGNQRLSGKDCTVAARFRPEPPRGSRITRGAVYTYVLDGVTHYTNVRPQGRGVPVRTLFTYVETCYACAPLPGVDFGRVRLDTTAWAAEVRAAATEFGVDEALVRAVIHAESAFNPNAVSHKGAQGLMQLIPATAERFGVENVFDPVQNIRGGVEYLAWLLDRFDGDVILAAAGYNAGEGNVDRHGGVPPFEETRRYVERVATLHARYREALAAAAGSAAAAASVATAAP